MIIIDTNVISELMRPEPNRNVVRWVSAQPRHTVFTTAISQAEILLGVELLPAGKRRRNLGEQITAMFAEDFEDRVLAFDAAAAPSFADIVAGRRSRGRPISHADAQIAAIARAHGALLATRNTGDFEDCGITVRDPWKR